MWTVLSLFTWCLSHVSVLIAANDLLERPSDSLRNRLQSLSFITERLIIVRDSYSSSLLFYLLDEASPLHDGPLSVSSVSAQTNKVCWVVKLTRVSVRNIKQWIKKSDRSPNKKYDTAESRTERTEFPKHRTTTTVFVVCAVTIVGLFLIVCCHIKLCNLSILGSTSILKNSQICILLEHKPTTLLSLLRVSKRTPQSTMLTPEVTWNLRQLSSICQCCCHDNSPLTQWSHYLLQHHKPVRRVIGSDLLTTTLQTRPGL